MQGKTKFIAIPLIIMVAAISLVVVLAWKALEPVKQKNGFHRNMIMQEATLVTTSAKDKNIVAISGTTDHHVYFRTKQPDELFVADLHLKKIERIKLNVPNTERISSAFTTAVDSPVVSIMANNGPAIIMSNLDNNKTNIYDFPSALFTRAVKISDSTFIFRGFDTSIKKMKQVFIKGNPITKQVNYLTSSSTIDGDSIGIASDGRLTYDTKTHLLMFVAFYSNKILCVDTNLNLIYKSKTIDTTNTPQITAGLSGSGTQYTNTGPARIINSKNCASNGKLYVISNLMADEEDPDKFQQRAVIDIYDIQSSDYQGSFYIPLFKHQKIRDFKVMDDMIITMYDKDLAIYKIDSKM